MLPLLPVSDGKLNLKKNLSTKRRHLIPSLHIPGHVGGGGEHVVPVPAGDGDEGHRGGVVAHLLDEPGHLLRDLLKPKANICAKDLKKKPG